MAAQRVVSLVPSLTETVLAWGIEPVAVTRFCEQPHLRPVGGTKDPDIAAIIELRPDVVLVNTEENRRQDVDRLVAAGVEVHVTEVERVADVAPMLAALADRLSVHPPPTMDGLAPAATAILGSAFIPIWRRPWMTMNRATYGSSLLQHLGIGNVYADAATRYPETSLEDAATRHPDLVLAPSEPYPFTARHDAELTTVAPVRFVDGQDLFWWGVRTSSAIERLRVQLLDPGAGGGAQ